LNIQQLLDLVVRPTLKELNHHSLAAERLVVGTICQESRGEYIKQLGNGPALGLIQMEPATHDDIWRNFLIYNPKLKFKIADLLSFKARIESFNSTSNGRAIVPAAAELIGNLNYCAAMCRAHYLRVPHALPAADDVQGLADYWKKYYNTDLGKGTADEFINNYPRGLK